jgi:hypothetical protein
MIDGKPATWLPYSPFRSPAWRWVRATWLREHGGRADKGIDDGWVARAVRFLAAREPSAQRPTGARRRQADPALQQALELADEQPPERRWHVQSLLLTSEPMEEIAHHHALSPDALEAYHELHFRVRPHLAATDWVLTRAVGTYWWRGFAGLPLGAVWKFTGYTAGARALEVIIAITTDGPLPAWLRASFTDNPRYDEASFRCLGKLAVAAMTTESEAEWRALLQAHRQFRRLDRQAAGSRDDARGLLPVMEHFLGTINRGRRPVRDTRASGSQPEGRDRDAVGAEVTRGPALIAALFEGCSRAGTAAS